MLFETRRALGAFYTPPDLAALVADWAIESRGVKVLEPSVGNGALLDAIVRRFDLLGGGFVQGFEIDEATIAELARYAGDHRVRVRQADFFSVEPAGDFDVVVANPPFTRNHDLSATSRQRFRARADIRGIASGAAGLWIYFVLASVAHLRPGGTLAFVVPGAVEFVDYAQPVLDHLCAKFAAVELIAIDNPVSWEGQAQERAVVLIARGFSNGSATAILRKRATTDGAIVEASSTLLARLNCASVRLGQIARLEIGSVTGANQTFLLSAGLAERAGLSIADLTPIAARARHVRGVSVTKDDLQQLATAGERSLLLTPDSLGPRNGPIRRHLATLDKARRRNTVWLNKRQPWWKVQLGRPFDGVFTYMNHEGPRLTLLEPGTAATNTLHKVTFNSRDPRVHQSACVAILSSYSQLHAEEVGRVYGGGVLKFELKNARSLRLLMPEKPFSKALFARVDTALKAGASDVARGLVDAELLPMFFGARWRDVQSDLAMALAEARTLRGARAGKLGGV